MRQISRYLGYLDIQVMIAYLAYLNALEGDDRFCSFDLSVFPPDCGITYICLVWLLGLVDTQETDKAVWMVLS